MAQLTWRDVATPNLSGTFQGYETFSKLLGDAVGAAQSAVTGLDTAKSDILNKEFSLALAGYQDPAQLARDVQLGRIGAFDLTDPNFVHRVSKDNLGSISPAAILKQKTDLLALDTSKLANEGTQIRNDVSRLELTNAQRTREQNLALDAMTPDLARAEMLRGRGLVKDAQLIEDKLDWKAAGFRNAQDYYTKAATFDSNYQSNRATTLTNDVAERNDALETKALDTLARLRPQIRDARDIELVLRYDEPFQKMSGREQEAVRARLTQAYAGSGAPAAISAAAGSGGGGAGGGIALGGSTPEGARDSVVRWAANLGIAPEVLATVISYETGGRFDPNIRGGQNRDGSGKGTFLGLIQMSETNQGIHGVKPGMSFEDQMPAVADYLKKNGLKPGMGLLDVYSIISTGRPGQYDRADVNGTVRQHVARMQAEHGPRAKAFLEAKLGVDPARVAARAAEADTLNQISQSNAFSFATDWAKAASLAGTAEDPNPTKVVEDLVKTTFAAPGVDKGKLTGYLQEIQARGRLKGVKMGWAEAAAILKHSIMAENFFERLAPGEALGGKTKIDWKMVDAHLLDVKNNKVQEVLVNNQNLQELNQRTQAALVAKEAAEQELKNVRVSLLDNPKLNPGILANAERNVIIATQAYDAALAAQRRATPGSMRMKPSASEQVAATRAKAPASTSILDVVKSVTPQKPGTVRGADDPGRVLFDTLKSITPGFR